MGTPLLLEDGIMEVKVTEKLSDTELKVRVAPCQTPLPYVGTLGSIWRPMRAIVLEFKDNKRKHGAPDF